MICTNLWVLGSPATMETRWISRIVKYKYSRLRIHLPKLFGTNILTFDRQKIHVRALKTQKLQKRKTYNLRISLAVLKEKNDLLVFLKRLYTVSKIIAMQTNRLISFHWLRRFNLVICAPSLTTPDWFTPKFDLLPVYSKHHIYKQTFLTRVKLETCAL